MVKKIKGGVSVEKVTAALGGPVSAARESFEMLSAAYFTYKNTVQIETTRRTAILAWRDTKLAELDNQRQVLEMYLKYQFQERAHLIDEFFVRLDQGIQDNNSHLIDSAIGAILNIARESPLANAKELITAMRDPSVKSIEI